MDLGLQGKMVVATEASKGIGYATAEAFLKEGAKVAVCSRHEDELKEVAQALSGLGGVYYGASDIPSTVENYVFAKHVHDRFGSLDMWVDNIGATGYKKGGEHNDEEIDFMTGICFKSVIYGCQAVFRYIKEQKKKATVNVGSLAARRSSAGRSTPYGPLKSAVNNLIDTFAEECYAHNVRVAHIIPGSIVTPLVKKIISQEKLDCNASSTLFRRMVESGEAAKPIVFPASDAAGYMTAVTIEVSDGRSMTLNPTCAYDGLEAKQRAKQKIEEKGGYLR